MSYIDPRFSSLPDEWKLRSLGEVADILDTKRSPLNALERANRKGIYPYCGANGIVDYIDEYRFDGEHVLIAEDGGYWGRSEQSSYIMRGKFWVNNHAHVIAAKDGLSDNVFLSSVINYMDISPLIGGDARGKLTKSILVTLLLPIPPLDEQRSIARVLSTVQTAIEQQARLIALTRELKSALMRKLFTEGLRGEKQKQKEIGLVPESWNVVKLDELLSVTQYGLSVRGDSEGKHPILRMTNQASGKIVGDNLQYVNISASEADKFRVARGDILFNRTNSFELVGRTAIFDLQGDFVFASYLIRMRTIAERLNPFFLNWYFNWNETQARLKSIATRAVSQSNISATRLRTFVVPLPTMQEQTEIVSQLNTIDQKIEVHMQKKTLLEELFRTLLHQLMTAQIRVNEVADL